MATALKLGEKGSRADRKLERRLQAASREIRRNLDSECVLRTAADAIQDSLRPSRTSVWASSGGGQYHEICAAGNDPALRNAAPGAVAMAADRARTVANQLAAEIAVPIIGPRTGVLGVIYVTGATEGPAQTGFVDVIAAEAGMALEAARLYEAAVNERDKTDAILARIADAVVVTDPQGTILQLNEAAEQIAGCPSGKATGARCEELLGLHAGEMKLDCSRGCALLAAGAGELDTEVWREREDNTRQPMLASVQPVRDGDKHVTEIVHSLRDITRLKEADNAKTMFLATASHELKTPLTVIQGFAEMLRTADWNEADRGKALEAMERRAVELNEIVERIMLSSRIESGRIDVVPVEVELGPLVGERVAALASATGRDLVAEIPEDLPRVLADPKAVVTVVDHLLDNAIKYSPDGGPVMLTAEPATHSVKLSVSDRGIGMDREHVAHAFDKFWQAESSDVRRFGGTGIGLYIVRSLVEAMDGTVTATSQPGSGSTFVVSLPRAGAPIEDNGAEMHENGQEMHEDGQEELERHAREPSVIREFMRQIGVPERPPR